MSDRGESKASAASTDLWPCTFLWWHLEPGSCGESSFGFGVELSVSCGMGAGCTTTEAPCPGYRECSGEETS